MTPSVAKYMAWRSRGMTWVETGSGVRPIRFGDVGLDARVDVGECADGARDGAGRDSPWRAIMRSCARANSA